MTAGSPGQLEQALWAVRGRAFADGEYVGQESFVSASEVLSLARRAGVGRGVSVLDLCCGTGGIGRFLTRELGCDYLGVDADPASAAEAVRRAREEGLGCRIEVADVPPLPSGSFDVVLLIETMLAFRDKSALLTGVSAALGAGGRFAFTVEEGLPLTASERTAMPGSDHVWPVPLESLVSQLGSAGLRVDWAQDFSASHRGTVDALVDAYTASAPQLRDISGGRDVVDELTASHRQWSRWLREGRVRKFAVVATKMPASRPVSH